ncbi:MAG: hypothetical protein QFB86_00255 [Patescibacteria group bacterium]|nr:hypothetical protein [Patescibacteria group bacterium]
MGIQRTPDNHPDRPSSVPPEVWNLAKMIYAQPNITWYAGRVTNEASHIKMELLPLADPNEQSK